MAETIKAVTPGQSGTATIVREVSEEISIDAVREQLRQAKAYRAELVRQHQAHVAEWDAKIQSLRGVIKAAKDAGINVEE